MKISFIRPRYRSVWEPLNIGYIVAYLKRYFREKNSLQLKFFDGFFDEDWRIIKGARDSDIVAFSCTSPQMKHALCLAHELKLKNPNLFTVFGGHHPSALPWKTWKLPQVDAVIEGEGERAFLEYVRDPTKGIFKRGFISNLDSIPFPDRKFIRQDRTIALTEKNDGERIASILSSRGCFLKYPCIFCTGDHDVFGDKIRRRSVNNVLNEIEKLIADWKVDFLKFADAEINSSVNWLKEFCYNKIKRGIDLPFGCNLHAGNITKELLELLKKAGCREVWIGCESGSPRILKEIRKCITVGQIIKVFDWGKEAGLTRRAYFILGSPSENLRDIRLTEKLAKRIDADIYGFTLMAHYPGTAIYDPIKDKDVDWGQVDEYSNNIWETKYLTNSELKQQQERLVELFKDRLCWRLQG